MNYINFKDKIIKLPNLHVNFNKYMYIHEMAKGQKTAVMGRVRQLHNLSKYQ